MHVTQHKPTRLFLILAGFFLVNVFTAEFIGVKIFSLERTIGWQPLDLTLFGQEGLRFDLTAGVLLWPVVFILTDVINEYFGRRGVRFISFLAVALILYAFAMFWLGIRLTPADWWPASMLQTRGIADAQQAFAGVFGQGLWIIAGSIVAFLVGQLLDVTVFQAIRRTTGERAIWLRATGSTLVSQFIDSFVVLFIAFKLGADWTWSLFLAVGTVNYIYKFSVAIVLTPTLYLAHGLIDRWLGPELAHELKETAAG